MTCNWYINGKRRCRKPAKTKARVSKSAKKGEPLVFPICASCAKIAIVHWKKHGIEAAIK